MADQAGTPGERRDREGAPRRRWRRVALIVLGTFFAVAAILLALAPTIAGAVAPGYVQKALAGSIKGKATVSHVSLSWFGGQRVGPVTISDAAGQTVAQLDISLSRGLAGLARGALGGNIDIGTATVSGTATVTRKADGTTNIQQVFSSGAPPQAAKPSAGPAKLPKITANVVLDKLDVRFVDEAHPGPASAVRIPAFSGTASVTETRTADVQLTGDVMYGPNAEHAATSGGSLVLAAHADSLTDAAGNLTVEQTKIDLKADAKDIATVVADTIVGMNNRLVAAVGEKMQASVRAAGTIADAEATVAASAPAFSADIALKTAGGVLTTPRPGKVSVQTAGMTALSPALADALNKGETAKFDRLPNVTATIDSVRIPLPTAGKPLDLRGAALSVAVETTEASGTVKIPAPDGRAARGQSFTIAPLRATLRTDDLAKGIALKAATNATISGQSAGTLAADVTAADLLDASGKPRAGMPGQVQGSVELKGVATAIAQPFADAAGLDLARDVGPQLDVALRAAPAPPGGQGAPATALSLDIKSANVNSSSRLVYDGSTIRTQPEGSSVRITEVGPLATRFLGKAGVSVDSGGPVSISVTNLVLDVARFNRAGAAGPDLRAVSADAKVETGPLAGKIAVQGQAARNWTLAPLTATVDAGDLSKGVAIQAATSATLDKSPAGALDVDVKATGLVSADGTPSKGLPAIDGKVGLTGVATTIAQPFVEQAGLDLPAGLGPTLDLALTASSKGGSSQAGSGQIPATDLDLKIRSTNLTGSVGLTLDGRTIRRRGDAADVTLRSPGTLAGRAARQSGLAISDGGYLKFSAPDFAIVLDEAWSPRLDQSTANVEFAAGGFSIAAVPKAAPGASPPAPSEPLALNQFLGGAQLAPGKTAHVNFKGSGSHQKAPFFTQGDLDLVGLMTADSAGRVALTPAKVRPVGTVEVNNLPTSLVALAAPSPAPPAQGGGTKLDLARLVREAVGPTATVKLASAQGRSPSARDVSLTLQSQYFNGGAAAGIDDKALAVGALDFRGQVTPGLAEALIDMLGPGLASRPTLVSPAAITVSATPFTLPLAGAAPDLSKAGEATLKVGLQGKALVNNVVLKSESGPPRDIGTVGLEDVLLTAAVDLSSLAAGSAPKPASVSITGGVLGGPDKRIVDLKGGARVPIAAGKPAGDLNADLALNVLDAAWLDSFLGQPGLIAGAAGPTASINAAAAVQFPKTAAASGSPAPAFERATLTASIKSPRMSTTQALKATAVPDRLSLDSGFVLQWTMDPEWGNRYVLGGKSLKPGEMLPARFSAPLDLTVTIPKLVLAMGGNTGPLKPGVFAADVQVSSAGTTLLTGDAKKPTPAKLTNLQARVSSSQTPNAIGFNVTVAEAGAAPAPGGKPAVQFVGGLYDVADAAGNPQFDKARLSMNGNAVGIPTAVVDALAKQDGLLIDALGPTVTLVTKTAGAGETSGSLSADLTSPRAEAHLKGSLRNGAFVAEGPARVELKSIVPELGQRFSKGLPLVGTFEKKPEDGPAVITATGLTLPIDGQLQRLNGQVVADLGQARFAASNIFSQILRLTGQRESGTIGRRLEPITVNIKSGVASYQRVTIPLGEFSFATEGTVDLVGRRLDVVTYIPFGALSDEAAGSLNSGLGKLLGGAIPGIERATMVPFRTSGSFENPDTKPDLQLMGQQLGKTLLRPDQVIGGGLEDLFKKLKPKK